MGVLEIFAAATEDNGTITQAAFEDFFAEIAGFVAAEQSLNEEDVNKLVVSSLYGLFDSDGNGVVDFMELSSRLTVLCGGDRETFLWDPRTTMAPWAGGLRGVLPGSGSHARGLHLIQGGEGTAVELTGRPVQGLRR